MTTEVHFVSGTPSSVKDRKGYLYSVDNVQDGIWKSDPFEQSCYLSHYHRNEYWKEDAHLLFAVDPPAVVGKILWMMHDAFVYGSSCYTFYKHFLEEKAVFGAVWRSGNHYIAETCVSPTECFNCPRVTPEPFIQGQVLQFECNTTFPETSSALRVSALSGFYLAGCELQVHIQPRCL